LLDKDDDVVAFARMEPKGFGMMIDLPTLADLKDDKLWRVRITQTTADQAKEEKYNFWHPSKALRLWKVEFDINVRR